MDSDTQPLDPSPLGFRPLTEDDFPLLHRWLNTPHVLEWWDNPGPDLGKVVAEYTPCIRGEEPTACYVITYGDQPIGYIQTYRIGDYPDYSRHLPVAENAAGVDLFIGEEAYVHRGLGGHLLRKFLREIVFASGAELCTIDPSVRNRIAIRAYEKAGFRHVATMQLPDEREPTYLMVTDRQTLEHHGPSSLK